MDALALARGLTAGRLAIGAAMVALPGPSMAPWLGADARRPATQVGLRAFGMRELFLGALGMHVASRPGVGRRTIGGFAALDAFDAGVTLAARRTLPPSGVALISALAGASAAAHVWVSRQLPDVA